MVSTYLRPDADQSDGSWLNESGSNTNLYASVDELTSALSDADYIQSSIADGDTVRLRLSDPGTGVTTPFIVRYRAKGTSFPTNLVGRLYQGNGTTLVAYWEQIVDTTFTDYTYTLSAAEFALITDVTDLYIDFEYTAQADHLGANIDLNFATNSYYELGVSEPFNVNPAVMLLHFDGTDTSTTFTDATGRQTAVANSDAQLDTAQSKFGTASVLMAGTSDRVDIACSADLVFPPGTDFTVDCWVRWSDITGQQIFIEGRQLTGNEWLTVFKESGHTIQAYYKGGIISGSTTVSANTWYHIAVTRSGTNTKLFLNGTQEGSTYTDNNYYGITSAGNISLSAPGFEFLGWVDELRVARTAVWTSNFTPPTAPYTVTAADPLDYLSISRASIGYAKNSAGYLVQFPTGTLRITDLGLLVEDARTNYLKDSATFTTGSNWGTDTPGTSVIITADQAVAPDGTTTMDKFDDGTANSRHIIYAQDTSNYTANVNHAFSIFVKDVDRRYVQVLFGSTGLVYLFADLQTGTITDSGTLGSGATFVSASIEAYANGVYRLILVGNSGNGETAAYFEVAMSNVATWPGGPNEVVYTGTNKSFYVWGAQFENNVSFASSYIPTTTAAVTRAAEVVTCTGNLLVVLAGSPASICVDAIRNKTDTTAGLLGFPAVDNSVILYANSNTTVNANNGTSFSATLGGSATWAGGAKAAIAWGNGVAASIVGGGGTVNAGGDPTSYGQASVSLGDVGSNPNNNWLFGYIRRLTAWNTRITDANLQTLTST